MPGQRPQFGNVLALIEPPTHCNTRFRFVYNLSTIFYPIFQEFP
jgi:hypothetical protein